MVIVMSAILSLRRKGSAQPFQDTNLGQDRASRNRGSLALPTLLVIHDASGNKSASKANVAARVGSATSFTMLTANGTTASVRAKINAGADAIADVAIECAIALEITREYCGLHVSLAIHREAPSVRATS